MNDIENKQLLSRQAANWFRAIAAIMVVLSHYAEWWTWFMPTEGSAETFRFAVSKLGVYGVDIFFLFSGYAMVKSLGEKRMNLGFIWKRIKNVYLPYFIVVGIIEVLSGGFTSVQDFWLFASGYDYWYIFVLFIFYLGFIAIWTIVGSKEARVVVFGVFTYVFSYILYNKGMHDFWYVSNIAFALGVIAGAYEEQVKRIADKAGAFLAAALSIGMVFVVRSGLFPNMETAAASNNWLIWQEIGATVMWTLLVMFFASKWRFYDKLLVFLGKYSLYIYLTHTYVFMRCVNNFECGFAARFAISAVITVIVSIICSFIITNIFKFIEERKKS